MTVTPGDQGGLEGGVNLGVETQPNLEGGLGLCVDGTGLAAESTTRESGSTLGTQTSEDLNGGAFEDGTKDTSHVEGEVAEELTEEIEVTGLHSPIGRVGESRAGQTGEHNK